MKRRRGKGTDVRGRGGNGRGGVGRGKGGVGGNVMGGSVRAGVEKGREEEDWHDEIDLSITGSGRENVVGVDTSASSSSRDSSVSDLEDSVCYERQ